MKSLVACIILFSLSQLVIAQLNSTFEKSYQDITWQNLVEELEINNKHTFYYKNEWVDSIKFAEITAGSLVFDILSDEFKKYGLNYYMKGRKIFIYPGPIK